MAFIERLRCARAPNLKIASFQEAKTTPVIVVFTKRIEHFSNKARAQVQDVRSAEPTTVAEHKLLDDAVRAIKSDARAAERYVRIGTGPPIRCLSNYR